MASSQLGLQPDAGRAAWLAGAFALFVAIYALRELDDNSIRNGIGFLFALPVALLAIRFGLRGGLAGALIAALVLFTHTAEHLHLSPAGYGTRIAILFGLGALIGWFTDREREARRQREREQGKVRRFFELSQDMLCTANSDGHFVDLNPAWQRTLGYREEELRAQPFVEFVHPEDRERTSREAAALFEGGVTVDFSNRYLAKDGQYRWLNWSSILGEDGMVYARATDITSAHEAQEALRAISADLERSNEDLKQFAYIASHDLNEPLRTIAGFAQLLERRYQDQVDERGRDYIRRMVGGVERMQALIADLLRYSRAGHEEAPPEPVDTADLTAEVLEDLGQGIAERGIAVRVEGLPTVVAHRNQLHQVFQNLIGNAIKFTNEDSPRVEVSAERENGSWRFSIADNGIGIDSAERARIFNAFERLHSREEFSGTGIGLAICKKIVERHGGEIRVEDGIEGGSRFTFTIPAGAGE